MSDLEETRTVLSVVTPAYNEAANLPLLYQRLVQVIARLDTDWGWILIDDHSAAECRIQRRGNGRE
jgi:glycosyltransferase involved in cell wall biosynthesis